MCCSPIAFFIKLKYNSPTIKFTIEWFSVPSLSYAIVTSNSSTFHRPQKRPRFCKQSLPTPIPAPGHH